MRRALTAAAAGGRSWLPGPLPVAVARRLHVRVAGIETSCDDTAVGVVRAAVGALPAGGAAAPTLTDVAIEADVLASQWHVHAAYGGVVPHFAARAHAANLPGVWSTAMRVAAAATASSTTVASLASAARGAIATDGAAPAPVLLDAVAVATGPGLTACLSAGITWAKGQLGHTHEPWRRVAHHHHAAHAAAAAAPPAGTVAAVPASRLLVPVHHLEAHVLSYQLMQQPVPVPVSVPHPVQPAAVGASAAAGAAPPPPPSTGEEGVAVEEDGGADVAPPVLVLLVSGGHSMVILTRTRRKRVDLRVRAPTPAAASADASSVGGGGGGYVVVPRVPWTYHHHDVLGGTVDDSAGEAFDKVARLLQVWRHLPEGGGAGGGYSGAAAGQQLQQQQDAPAAQPRVQLAGAGAGPAAAVGASDGLHFRTTPHDATPPASFSLHLGAALERLAAVGNARAVRFPMPLRAPVNPSQHHHQRGGNAGTAAAAAGARKLDTLSQHSVACSFSFSGLKSAVARFVAMRDAALAAQAAAAAAGGTANNASGVSNGGAGAAAAVPTHGVGGVGSKAGRSAASAAAAAAASAASLSVSIADVAASFQATVVEHLCEQLSKALAYCTLRAATGDGTTTSSSTSMPPVSAVVVCGGVAANGAVRQGINRLAEAFGIDAVFPPLPLCADNGVMIAWAGARRLAAAQAAAGVAVARAAGRDTGGAIPPLPAAVLADAIHPGDLEAMGVYPSCASAGAGGGAGGCSSSGGGGGASCGCAICELDIDPRWRLNAPPPIRQQQ